MFSETKQAVFLHEPKTNIFNKINNNPKVIIFHDMWNMERFMCRLKPVDCLSLSLISFSMMSLPSYITAINVATMREIFWLYKDGCSVSGSYSTGCRKKSECKYMRKWPDLPQHVVHLVKHASTESQTDDNSECASDALWLTSDPIKESSPASPR